MLLKLSDKISDCLGRAAEAREAADAASDPTRKADWAEMELRWLRLVESYRFVEQVSRFLEDSHAARTQLAETSPTEPRGVVGNASLIDSLGVLVRTAIESAEGEVRAAFYMSDGAALHHVIGMPEAYARHVDGFAIGPQSLACGLSAFRGEPIITRDVAEEPRWQPWLWLAKEFEYRACWSFPVATSAGKIVGTFAMYYRDPREAKPRDLDLAATITRAAAIMISQPQPAPL